MRLMRLTLMNMKRQIKNPMILVMSFIMPVIMIISVFGNSSKEENKVIGNIGIIDNSNSIYSEELIENLSERYNISLMTKEEEKEGDHIRNIIMDNKLTVVYEIPENFQQALESGEIPKIKCYKTEAAEGIIIGDDTISNYINTIAQEEISEGLSSNAITTEIELEDKDKSKGASTAIVLMLCYFMFMGGSVITEDLIKLKTQKVLRRTISTANTDKQVLGGIFLSAFLIHGILASIGFALVRVILKMEIVNIPLILLVIFLGSLIATAVIAATTRWIKNVSIASLFVVVYALINYGITMSSSVGEVFDNVPQIIVRLGAFSPFTWLFKILEKGEIIIPTLVIILMSLVFFTAGSFRLRDFAKE